MATARKESGNIDQGLQRKGEEVAINVRFDFTLNNQDGCSLWCGWITLHHPGKDGSF